MKYTYCKYFSVVFQFQFPFYFSGDHAETVDVDYDPKVVDYSQLLDHFWKNHDPTFQCQRQVSFLLINSYRFL